MGNIIDYTVARSLEVGVGQGNWELVGEDNEKRHNCFTARLLIFIGTASTLHCGRAKLIMLFLQVGVRREGGGVDEIRYTLLDVLFSV